MSYRYVVALWYGRSSPTLETMKFLAGAASDILGSRVRLADLFDLDFKTYDEAP